MYTLAGACFKLEAAQRFVRNNSKAGGSNYAFADGSARFLKYRGNLYPLNLWMISDYWRTNRASAN